MEIPSLSRDLLADVPPAVVVALGVTFVLLLVLRVAAGRRRATPSLRNKLKAIKRAPVSPVAVLNRAEQNLFQELSGIIAQSPRHRLLVQVSMGEFLRLAGKGASNSLRQTVFNLFNAKRVDMLIVDAAWQPVMAIEYQGGGHYRGNAKSRDAIKRAVCERAGIRFMEVPAEGLTPGQRRDLSALVGARTLVAAE